MAKKEYTEQSVIRSLSKNNDIIVNTKDLTIETLKDSTSIGNSSYGKIDYLCKVHGYRHFIVNSLSNKKANRVRNDNNEEQNVIKGNKRDKLNMASMVKNTMKKNKK